jgi:hypothetical protein
MRLISFPVTGSLALLSAAALAQQPPATAGDTIGHPPPIPGPPPLPEPSATQPPAASSKAPANQPAPKGYTGAYTPAGPPTPYSTGPLPQSAAGAGLNVVGPDGVSTRTVKTVPCGVVALETDGFTTCVGLPDQREQSPRKRRRY